MMKRYLLTAYLGVLFFTWPAFLHGQTGSDAWLRYAALSPRDAQQYSALPTEAILPNDSVVLNTAREELVRGIGSMLGRSLRINKKLPTQEAIILATLPALRAMAPKLNPPQELREDGYWLTNAHVRGFKCLIIASATDRGVLYGAFALLSKIARNENIAALNELQQPYAPIRWVNQWDNLDGHIERGYAGPSIFFDQGSVRADLTRASEYARLLASLGINGCTVNNVNADPRILEDNFLLQLVRIADVFRPWGVQLSISVDLGSPKIIGGLDTFDPLDPHVAAWWRQKADTLYRQIPDFGGFVMKADSEGRVGPSTYRRTHADAANVIARALKPHGGIVFYRAFVYDHHLDWQNMKNDRAKAAYDNFRALDGEFDENVIIQIKHGPIDFQVREPVSPLLGVLSHTNESIELQITQEYTGQQRHLCFLVPMWKEALDFDMHVDATVTPVKNFVAGKTFHRPLGGFVGVANVGMDENWLGHPLAMANLYGFGRLAWNPNLSSQEIAEEWTRLTFGNDALVVQTIVNLQLASWPVYENYTGPLGAGTLTDILGSHYGPAPDASEHNGWGQWFRADHDSVGMDRTLATGTGYIGQYSPAVQAQYESLANCPDALLLFFHHVSYTHVLHSGKTVIQHIYDSHFEGAERAQQFVSQWQLLHGHLEENQYRAVLSRLQYQAGHAIVWRDAICNWFHRISGIADEKGRLGNYPGRVEAEDMQLHGYIPFDVIPWEAASGGKAIECPAAAQHCTAATQFHGAAGRYELDVEYFDQNNGVSKFRIYVHDKLVDEWSADDHLPTTKPNADSATRRHIPDLELHPGDEIRIEGVPDSGESAALDYIKIHRHP